jgi:hypothetical protein
MYYHLELAAKSRQEDLLREAELDRLIRLAAGPGRIQVRKPLGQFLVRLGNRLNGEPRRQPQLAGIGDAA